MPPDENAQATNDEEITGQIAAGKFILRIGDGNGGVVQAADRVERPGFTRRKEPVNLRPRPFLALLDRDGEIAAAKSALQASLPVSFVGPAGIGKTALLRSLAHLPETDRFPDGVVYLSVATLGLEDAMESLFEAFYTGWENSKPAEAELRAALQGVKALILLDDFHLNREETITLLAAMPGCVLVLASLEGTLAEKGESIELRGLPPEEALDLFVLELNRSLDRQELAEVREICEALACHPLRILQAASLVREKLTTITGLKSRLHQDTPDQVILSTLFDSSSESQRNVIAILAAAGGLPVPIKILGDISQPAELKSDLQKLVALGLVQAQDSNFSLAGDLSATASRLLDLTPWEDRLVEYLAGWLANRPRGPFGASVGLSIHILHKAEQKGRWQDVLRLGQGLESALILSRRWGTWLEVLDLVLMAARALNDQKVEAWTLHQTGTRAACLGLDEPAREYLRQALKIRQASGDRAGLAATRNNLRTFFNIPRPAGVLQARTPRFVTCCTAIAGVFVIVSILVAGLILLFSKQYAFPAPLAAPTGTVVRTPAMSPAVIVSTSPTLTPYAPSTPAQTPPPEILIDFVSQAERAVWESSETFDPNDNVFQDCDLTFGAQPLGPCGFARWGSMALEDDSLPQSVLVVEPYHSNGAQIRGTYDLTNLTLSKGDRLVTVVGFLKAAETLGVAFNVTFTTGDPNFTPVVIYETRDRNDGRLVEGETPLPEAILGQNGYFILQMVAAPNTNANWAAWVVARLERP